MAYISRILDVRDEDVIGDLGGQARRIPAQCGLAWDAPRLIFHDDERPVRTASVAQKAPGKIYGEAAGRTNPYEKFPAPLREALGKTI